MPLDNLFENQLLKEYDALSQQLRVAADYVVANPIDVATRSLRSVSAASGLAPATFSRLARALGFDAYEDLRELARGSVYKKMTSFSAKAGKLQQDARLGGREPLLARQSSACVANVDALAQDIDPLILEAVVNAMHLANRVLLLGVLGSTGIVEYMSYLANFFSGKYQLASTVGASTGSLMVDLGKRDAIVIVTKPPFARHALHAAEMAKSQGAFVIVITDTRDCPALRHADAGFVLHSESPQFFSSYAATIVLIETMIGMLVSRAGPDAQKRISEVEARNHQLNETLSQ